MDLEIAFYSTGGVFLFLFIVLFALVIHLFMKVKELARKDIGDDDDDSVDLQMTPTQQQPSMPESSTGPVFTVPKIRENRSQGPSVNPMIDNYDRNPPSNYRNGNQDFNRRNERPNSNMHLGSVHDELENRFKNQYERNYQGQSRDYSGNKNNYPGYSRNFPGKPNLQHY